MRVRLSFVCINVLLAILITAACGWCGTIFTDDFSRNTIGSIWMVIDDPYPSGPSQWAIGGGALTQSSNIYRTDREYEFWQGTHIVAGDPYWTNYDLAATCSSGDNDGWGLIVRYQNGDNYYRFITVADGGNGGPFRRLEKFVDGKRTVLAEDKNAFTPGRSYNVKLSAQGPILTLWIDEQKAISASDNTFTSGKIGFLTYADTGFVVKNIAVTSTGGSASTGSSATENSGSTRNWADNFSRNGIGSVWTVVDDPYPSGKSDWVISGGALIQRSNIYRTDREYEFWQGTHIVAGDPSWRDYEVSATCSSDDNDGWGMIVRYQDKNNYYRFITVADGGNGGPFRRLEKFVDGSRTVLAEDKSAFQPGKSYQMKLLADGPTLRLWIDGDRILTATDNTFASGRIGFMTYADTGFRVRNVGVSLIK